MAGRIVRGPDLVAGLGVTLMGAKDDEGVVGWVESVSEGAWDVEGVAEAR
jgi:hypothetical protein